MVKFMPHRPGTQIAALNWQRYDRGMQFNEAMFVGTGGWVVKPDRLRGIKPFDDRRPVRLSCELIGGCNSKWRSKVFVHSPIHFFCFFTVPKPRHDIKLYVYAELFVDSGEKTWKSQVRHPVSAADSPLAEVLFNEKFHWEYLEEDVAFMR